MVFQIMWLSWVLPITGACVAIFFPPRENPKAGYIPLFAIGAALLCTLYPLGLMILSPTDQIQLAIPFAAGLYLDIISLLFVTLTLGSTLILCWFTLTQKKSDLKRSYWPLLQLLAGGLVYAVITDNLLHIFIGWEIVSLVYSGLVGLQRTKRAIWAGLKSFIVFRIGAGFLLIGFLLIYASTGTFSLLSLIENPSWLFTLQSNGTLQIALVCILMGIVTKLAQFPFHSWLPNATTAIRPELNGFPKAILGLYLPVRLFPILSYGMEHGLTEVSLFFSSLTAVALISGIVATVSLLTQQDIWRALAYYFMSQYARLLISLGIGGMSGNPVLGYTGAITHLIIDSIAVLTFVLILSYRSSYQVQDDTQDSKTQLNKSKLNTILGITIFIMIGFPFSSLFWTEEVITTAIIGGIQDSIIGNQPLLLLLSSLSYIGMLAFMSLISFGLVRIFGKYTSNGPTAKADTKHNLSLILRDRMFLISIIVFVVLSVFSPILVISLETIFSSLFHHAPHPVSLLEYVLHSLSTVQFYIGVAILGISSYLGYRWYIRRAHTLPSIIKHPALIELQTKLSTTYNVDNLAKKGLRQIVRSGQWLSYTLEEKFFCQRDPKAPSSSKTLAPRFDGPISTANERRNKDLAYILQIISLKLRDIIEVQIINRIHQGLISFAHSLTSRFRKTHTGVLSYNLLAVTLAGLIILCGILIFGGFLF